MKWLVLILMCLFCVPVYAGHREVTRTVERSEVVSGNGSSGGVGASRVTRTKTVTRPVRRAKARGSAGGSYSSSSAEAPAAEK